MSVNRDARPEDRPGRLAVGVLGVGRVGSVLGAALHRAGHQVVAATGVSETSVDRAARLLPGVPLLPADEVARQADLLLVAVPDDVLGGLVEGWPPPARSGPVSWWRTQRGVRARRAVGGDGGWCPAAGAAPAMTFTGRAEDLDRLAGVSFGVTAPEPLRPAAEALVLEMGGEPQWVAEAGPPALPRGAGPRREPPGHPRQRGRGPAAPGGRTRTGADDRAAAVRVAGQHAAAG